MRPVSFLIATLVAATALAQAKPSPRLGDLKAFVGNWKCAGTAFQTNWGPEHPTSALCGACTPGIAATSRGVWLSAACRSISSGVTR